MRRFRGFSSIAGPQGLVSKVKACSSASQLESLILSSPEEEFDAKMVAVSLTQLVSTRSTDRPTLDKILSLSRPLTLQPRELSECCQAFASGRLLPFLPPLFLDQIRVALPYFRANGIADALGTLARLRQVDVPVDFLDAVCQEIQDRELLPYFSRTFLVSLMGSLYQLGYVPPERMVEKFALEVTRRSLSEYKPAEIATLLMAFAKWDVKFPSLMEKFSQDVIRRDLTAWRAKDLASLVESVAKADIRNRALLSHLESSVARRDLTQLFPENLCLLLSAFAQFGTKYVLVLQRLSGEVEMRDLEYFSPAQLVSVVRSLAELSYKSGPMLDRVAVQVASRPSEFSSAELVHVLNAFARFAHPHEDMICAVAEELTKRPPSGGLSSYIDVAYSLACLDALSLLEVKAFFSSSVDANFEAGDVVLAERLALTKLAWSLTAKRQRPSALLRSLDRDDWVGVALQHRQVNFSPLHVELHDMLANEMEDDIVEYKRAVEGVVVVDAFVNAKNLAIEFESPAAFLLPDRVTRTGAVALRRRLLARLGVSLHAFPMKGFGILDKARQEEAVKEFVKGMTEKGRRRRANRI